MIPSSPGYVAIVVGVALISVFALALVGAAALNRFFGTPAKFLLVSTGAIGAATYAVSAFILLIALPPLRWNNSTPADTRTALWDHLALVAAIPTVLAVALWQMLKRRKLQPVKAA